MQDTNRKQSAAIFFLLYLLALIFYFPSRYAGFVTDFIGFEEGYSRCGLIHYYSCSGMPGLRFAGHIFTYALCKTVGPDTVYWYILYCFFHSLAAYLGFVLIKKLLIVYETENAFIIALATSLLFLLSPYQAEVVVWRACIQYCFVCIALFLNCILLLSYFENPKFWKPIAALLTFIVGMFSLEQAVSIPVSLFCISVIVCWSQNKNLIKKSIALFVAPQIFFIGFYFLLNKLLYHKWIMIYGASVFNDIFSIDTLAKFFRYAAKYIFMVRFFPENIKDKIMTTISNPYVVIVLTVLGIAIIGKLVKDSLSSKNKSGIYLLLILLYVATLLPVIQLYDTHLLLSENDRLGYVSSFFLFAILAIFLIDRKNKILSLIYFAFLVINIYFLVKMVHCWKQSNDMLYSYANSFDANEKNETIIVGVPDNYKGILMMRIYGNNSAVEEFINYRLKKKVNSKINEVAFFNQVAFNDGINVKKENDSTLYMSFKQDGNWFWRSGIGLSNYENEKYKVVRDEWNGYRLYLKDVTNTHYTIMYPDSSKFKKFDF